MVKIWGIGFSGEDIVIIYDMKCRGGHKFEGWFKDRETFEAQKAKRLVACPVCGSADVKMVPSSVAIMGREPRSTMEKSGPEVSSHKIISELQEYIRKNFDDVGERFAEVAIRIHHGEEEKRNIRGTATQSDEETLLEEGIQFIKLPLPKFDG